MSWNPIKTIKELLKDPAKPVEGLVHGDVLDTLEPGGVLKATKTNWKHLGPSIKGIPKDISDGWAGIQGKKHKSGKADELAQTAENLENEQFGTNEGYTDTLGDLDQKYLGTKQANVADYLSDVKDLRGQTEGAQTDAKNTYTNDIQPRLKDLMETSQKNAGDALSLKDATDPNNKIATATRALYNDQGDSQQKAYNTEADYTRGQYNTLGSSIQKQYEQQAQNEGRAGLADTATLQALGMQNMAGQLGSVPMSGGQLQALMGANQAQSGANYSKTLQRGQSLRDQGIQGNIGQQQLGINNATTLRTTGLGRASDLQSKGLDQGFARSDIAYGQGQDAIDRYGKSVGNYEGAFDRQQGRDKASRQELGGLSDKTYNLREGMNDTSRNVEQGGILRHMANYNTHLGGKQANIVGQIQGINAGATADANQITGITTAGGAVVGGIYGGPAGAAAGGAAGKAIGDSAQPEPNAIPQTGDYTHSSDGEFTGPPSPVGSSAGSQGAAGMEGTTLTDPQVTMAQRMRRMFH